MYYVYIIRCDDNSLYTGITNNLEKRMKEHYYKLKAGAKYTKTRNVTNIEILWLTNNRSDASKLECYLKKLTKEKKELLIVNQGSIDLVECKIISNIVLEDCINK